MRKTMIIIAVGVIVALFPLVALPPRMEAWILLIIGMGIIIFGLYERIVQKEKDIQQPEQYNVSQEFNEEDTFTEEDIEEEDEF